MKKLRECGIYNLLSLEVEITVMWTSFLYQSLPIAMIKHHNKGSLHSKVFIIFSFATNLYKNI